MTTLEDQLEHALYKNRLLEDNLIEVIRENELLKEDVEGVRARSRIYDESVDRMEELASIDQSKDCPNCVAMRGMAQQFIRENARLIEVTEESLGEVRQGINQQRVRQALSTEIAVGTEALNKPFMDYLLKNSEFDREELDQLKRKINQIKSKEAKENL